MNKRELIEKVARDARLTRTQAARALAAFLDGVRSSLAQGDRVTLAGFGTFTVSHRKARLVRDPRSVGRTMKIAAHNAPRFAPGIALKAAIQHSGKITKIAGQPS